MNIQLSSHAQEVLKRHLAGGEYTSPEEVIERALDLLDAPEQSFDSLKEKIQEGLDDIAAGRVVPLDVEETIRRGRARLSAGTQQG